MAYVQQYRPPQQYPTQQGMAYGHYGAPPMQQIVGAQPVTSAMSHPMVGAPVGMGPTVSGTASRPPIIVNGATGAVRPTVSGSLMTERTSSASGLHPSSVTAPASNPNATNIFANGNTSGNATAVVRSANSYVPAVGPPGVAAVRQPSLPQRQQQQQQVLQQQQW
mmetsp:Transcript_35604/g.76885  ORF Transcript_35604/g.76885 Transcript_35604/m.76885 type:complete len:165 (-) Transcript_35604:72-566(-)